MDAKKTNSEKENKMITIIFVSTIIVAVMILIILANINFN